MAKRTLSTLQRKQTKLIIGLMSGTSMDGIDAVLLRVSGSGHSTRLRQLSFKTFPYPKGLKERLLKNCSPKTSSVDDICRLNVLLGHVFASAVKAIAKKGGVPLARIDLIGSHGQTIQHLPIRSIMYGKTFRSTLQIGDPSTIAKLTGIPTVGDFRMADMALGGQGAPLVPNIDYLLFRSPKKNRLILNIGGIANITVLPKNCSMEDVRAFDTGPGNMLIDNAMKILYQREYDANGSVAAKGEVITDVLYSMLYHYYFSEKPPKSTGREMFGSEFVTLVLNKLRRKKKEDLIATFTEFTPLTIFDQYRRFVAHRMNVDELLVGGGGIHNRVMMRALGDYFSNAEVLPMESLGYSSDAKEAICFALLANEAIAGNESNLPGVTGASGRTILGKICL
ncbi:MAG: anhydro-N-acetylmuramic acid kinase [bacterium]